MGALLFGYVDAARAFVFDDVAERARTLASQPYAPIDAPLASVM